MFRKLVNGYTEFYQDGELKAVIADENLDLFKRSIGIDEALPVVSILEIAVPVPGELVPGELMPVL